MPVLVNAINNIKNTKTIDVNSLAAASAPSYIRQILTLIDSSASRSAGTTWTLGATWSPYPMKAYSTLKIYYMWPARNESTSWGGIYFEPQVTFNNGTTWYSLGSRGYDMMSLNAGGNIKWSDNYLYVDPGQTADFTFGLRYYFKAYDGTVGLNNTSGYNHDINVTSGTASFHPSISDNNNQHYVHFIVEEIASLKG